MATTPRLLDSEITFDYSELTDDEQVLLTVATGGSGTICAIDPDGETFTVDLRRVDPEGELGLADYLELLAQAIRQADRNI